MLFLDENFSACLKDKWILLDNNFLSLIFHDGEIFSKFQQVTENSILVLDPFVKFEFLRDVHVIKERELREQFISRGLFVPLTAHKDTYNQLLDKALEASRFFSFFGKNSKKPEFVDYFLIARMMLFEGRILVLTANKKDFPGFLFDTVSSITVTSAKDPNFISYYLLSINNRKHKVCEQEVFGKIIEPITEDDIPF